MQGRVGLFFGAQPGPSFAPPVALNVLSEINIFCELPMEDTISTPSQSPPDGNRFAFGQNWASFLSTVNEQRIAAAQGSLQALLRGNTLSQRRFLDAGCGSGLFSLAAVRLGAAVTSFDVDSSCVACACELKKQFCDADANWNIHAGSLLDRDFLSTLGCFDIVYCWGVAHHTGSMWESIQNLLPLVAPSGLIILAIYNDQLYISRACAR